ncbi:restriction endonuclease subunit S [Vibrio cholerae]|nr:restriction endonuclease subunit S [Vibrio cholerae]
MSQLPSSWRETPIETVTEVVSGGTPSSKHPEYYTEDHEDSIAWVTPADLSGYKEKYISHGRRSITKSGYDSCSAKLMPKGTVLFSSRAPIGYTVIAANEISTNQGFKSFVPVVGVNETYLYYYLRSIKHLAESLATGTTFKELSGKVAKTLPFPLAPLAEQTRIVEKLDEVLAQVDTIKERLDGIPAILKRFRQSVLAAAVSGKLTEEWRGSRDYIQYGLQLAKRDQSLDIPENWKPQKLEDSCGIVSGNAFKSKDLLDSGDVPVVKISNVQYGKFEVKNQQFLPSSFLDGHKKYLIVEDDLLMALTRPITNGTLKVCRYPVNQTDGLLNQRVCKFEFKNNEEKNFFELLFQSSYFKEQVEDNLSETLQPNLSPKDLKRLLVFIPELDEQKEIVRLVDQYFAFADTIETQVKKAQARVDKLTQSILAKAFRGELVPQDPNDEPADKLLERIALARKEAEVLAKAAKKTAKK